MQNNKNIEKPKTTDKKNIHFIYAIIIGAFIFSAIMTIYINEQPDEPTESQTLQADEKIKKDSIVVTPAIETDPYEELESLVGLNDVKEEVRSLANFVKIQKEREAQGLKVPSISYHCVFTGNPGTGKTTIARILARIYKDLGVLKKGHLVETDRSGLIAEYVGQTATKTNAIIDSALNGVLFIDEAYALTTNSRNDYGSEAIATLVKRMEDDRDSLVVIVAGYKNEMKDFVASNPGLQSRFTRYIEFPDYTPTELTDIFYLRARKYSYELDKEADAFLRKQMTDAVANKTRNFGNARYVRNVFEKAITIQANRLAKTKKPSTDELKTLTVDDLRESFNSVKR